MAISRGDVHLIVAIFLGSLIIVQAWDVRDAGIYQDSWGASPEGGEDYDGIAVGLFDTWVVPFEILSLLLLVGLVGAIAIASRSPDDEGGER